MSEIQILPAHSKIGASSMHRWKECPGSVRLSSNVPRYSSAAADEGTYAHDIAAKILLHESLSGTEVTEEMLEAIKVYVDCVMEAYNADPGNTLLVEKKFDLSSIHRGLYGTSDAIVINPTKKLLQVFDYKHGKGIAVDVEENEQLLYYGLGALISTGFKCDNVELIIVQPRCQHTDGPIRRWLFDSFLLLDFAADLKEAAVRTEDPNAPLKPGDHCRFCPAKAICPALHQKALALAQEEFKPSLSYDPLKLAQTLTMLDAIENWAKGVREFAYREALHGRIPPGWKLVEKRASRKWRSEDEVMQAVELELFPGLIETKLKTVAQVEKIVGKSEFKEIFESLTIKESSGTTLVPESDKRPAVKAGAEADFKVITNDESQEDLFS